jgi:hypothetical protein
MPVMDVGHVSVLVLGVGMQVFMRMSHLCRVVFVKFIVYVPVLMHDRHMDVEMSVFFVCQ